MFNCVVVKINGRPKAIFHTIREADNYRDQLMELFPHIYGPSAENRVSINCDWAFIEGLPF